MLREWLL